MVLLVGAARSARVALVLGALVGVACSDNGKNDDHAASAAGKGAAPATGGAGGSSAGMAATTGGTSGSVAGRGGTGGSGGMGGGSAGTDASTGGSAGSSVGGMPNAAAGSSSTADGGEAGADPGTPVDDTERLRQILTEYHDWTPRTVMPVSISTDIFLLCRGPTQAEQDFVDSEHGDKLYLLDFLDDASAEIFSHEGTGPFPEGAAIVKEKLVLNNDGNYDLSALGLMLKREAGFDPAHGDWQFGFWNLDDGLIAGTAENDHCGNCHANAATDFVFMDYSWREPTP